MINWESVSSKSNSNKSKNILLIISLILFGAGVFALFGTFLTGYIRLNYNLYMYQRENFITGGIGG